MALLKRLFGAGTDRKAPTTALLAARESDIEPIDVTDESFGAVIEGSVLPALVDFWAPWCGPCRMIGPIISDLAKEYAGRVLVARMNADESSVTVDRLGIQGIPTVVFYSGGQEVGRVVGFVPRHVLADKVNALLS